MALARTLAVTLAGISGRVVEVEADVTGGVPGFTLTGLPDASVSEARDRVRAAVVNSGVPWPVRRITIALLPADVRKVGSGLDLAVAMAVLAAAGAVGRDHVAGTCWLAELGLDGKLRPVRGMLPAVVAARAAGVRRMVVAPDNGAEAALVEGVDVRVAETLHDVLDWLRGQGDPPKRAVASSDPEPAPPPDLADVAGQTAAKLALEVAAAGGHHLSLVGAPGAGKTMLAERLPGVLPPLPDDVALEVTAVHSVAGLLGEAGGLVRRAPLQAPHHSASTAALVGGGSHLARPGAASLAHGGVLFLDEAAEFSPHALDALRQPMETGRITLHRSGGAVTYPARFLLVLAANPCPCGRRDCECPPPVRRRYRQRLSGPLLDRIDLRVEVDPVPAADLLAAPGGEGAGRGAETSAAVASRVAAARAAAAQRWRDEPWELNAQAPGARLRRPPWRLPPRVLASVEGYLQRGELSARGFDRVLRLAWTIADLEGATVPETRHVADALFYRTAGRSTWSA